MMPTPELWKVYMQILMSWLVFYLRGFNIYLNLLKNEALLSFLKLWLEFIGSTDTLKKPEGRKRIFNISVVFHQIPTGQSF